MHTAFLFYLIFNILYLWVFAGLPQSLKWASGPLELELQRVVTCVWLETKPWPSAIAGSAGNQ